MCHIGKERVSICRVQRPEYLHLLYTLPLACLLFILIIVVDLITSGCAEKDIYIFFVFFSFSFRKQWDDEVYHVGFLSPLCPRRPIGVHTNTIWMREDARR